MADVALLPLRALVESDKGRSLFHLVRMQHDLVGPLGRECDVISVGGVLPPGTDVRREAVWL